MQVQNLSEPDKVAFRSLRDSNSRAHVITMIASTRDTINGFMSYPQKVTHEVLIGQLQMFNRMVLTQYGFLDLKRYVDTAITQLGDGCTSRMDWTAVRMSLDRAEKAFRGIDSEGHGASADRPSPKETQATQGSGQLLSALKTTPLHVGLTIINPHFITALAAYLQGLSIGELHQLKDYCSGKSQPSPEAFTTMFGTGLNDTRLETLKSVVNACIVSSRSHGLSVETNSSCIQESVRNSQDRYQNR